MFGVVICTFIRSCIILLIFKRFVRLGDMSGNIVETTSITHSGIWLVVLVTSSVFIKACTVLTSCCISQWPKQ